MSALAVLLSQIYFRSIICLESLKIAMPFLQMKPERVQAIQDFIGTLSKDLLYYKAMDIITVLDRK